MLTIRILGTGCPRCEELYKMCLNILAEKNINADLQKITDLNAISEYGVFHTPALVINDRVMSSGKLPTKSTLLNWIRMNADSI